MGYRICEVWDSIVPHNLIGYVYYVIYSEIRNQPIVCFLILCIMYIPCVYCQMSCHKVSHTNLAVGSTILVVIALWCLDVCRPHGISNNRTLCVPLDVVCVNLSHKHTQTHMCNCV